VDDFLILAIGRQFIELCAQREELSQALKKAQTQQVATAKPPEVPEEG
jgi:hypothetical protein